MASQQSLAQFQTILEKHRANQSAYKQKIKEINLTRGKISDQFEILQQTYDKKIKGFEQKLQIFKTQNESLIRQNAIYKSEIETYQSRLLEKEKIIAMLLSQRKDLPVVGSSDKSKSDKTDSLKANEEESKSFKKHGVGNKEEYDHPIVQKFKQEPLVEQTKKNIQNKVTVGQSFQNVTVPKNESLQQSRQVKKIILPPKKRNPNASLQNKSTESLPKSTEVIQQSNPNYSRPPPPPFPTNKSKTRKAAPSNYNIRKYETQQQEIEENPFQVNNYFKDLGKSNIQQVVQTKTEIRQQQYEIIDQPIVSQQQISLPQQEIHEEVDLVQQVNEVKSIQPEINNQIPQEQQTSPKQNFNYNSFQAQVQQNSNNFLSHFNNSNNFTENVTERYQQTAKKPNKKSKRTQRSMEMQTQVNGNDFFSQLAKTDNEPQHSLQIEESSIDHIDRDNSLLSNQPQLYFEEREVRPKPVKMPKKKGKRDQIKMMDPSCFE